MDDLPMVLIPDQWGQLAVCDPEQLIDRLAEGESLEDAIENSAIDYGDPTPDFLAKVRELNITGNVDSYWGR